MQGDPQSIHNPQVCTDVLLPNTPTSTAVVAVAGWAGGGGSGGGGTR